jgi:hypothetical protein
MISEIDYSNKYSSFWKENVPWLEDYYAAVDGKVTRLYLPARFKEKSSHIYITNIIATIHLKNRFIDPLYSIDKSFEDSMPVISAFEKRSRRNSLEEYIITEDHRKLITLQVERMEDRYKNNLHFEPSFPGCGLLGNCEGDLICDKTLVEIKARSKGKRAFDYDDFKQILVYCALNYLAGDIYDIQRIELFNPREGVLWGENLNDFVFMISNSEPSGLFEKMGDFMSSLSEPFTLANFNNFDL